MVALTMLALNSGVRSARAHEPTHATRAASPTAGPGEARLLADNGAENLSAPNTGLNVDTNAPSAPPPDAKESSAKTGSLLPDSRENLEDLMFRDFPGPPPPVVTSATRVEQPIYEAPSSITVITAEDIRRSGARRLVDVFRWVPGMDVFHSAGNRSAVSVRGVYNYRPEFINEMLVLVDGRSIYIDILGGVDWNTLPVFLEEIDRIEVIRGPSGSLYGPNAFAGTINIYTKKKPEPGLLHGTIGSQRFREGNVIQWFEGENYEIRLGLGWRNDDGFDSNVRHLGLRDPEDYNDAMSLGKFNAFGHFRLSKDDDLELRGGWVTGRRGFEENFFDATHTEDVDVAYGQAMWEHRFSEDANLRATYYRNQFVFGHDYFNGARGLDTWMDVWNIEQFWRIHPRHQLVFGAEYRLINVQSPIIAPRNREENYRSFYIEDNITLIEKKLHFLLGSRYDDYTVSGDDFSPRAALVWTPSPAHSFRASLARSVSTPALDVSFFNYIVPDDPVVVPPFGPIPAELRVLGNDGLNPESVLAYEAGYRGRWSERLDVGVDLFVYDVADLIRPQEKAVGLDLAPPVIFQPVTFENELDTIAWGGELSVTYRWNKRLTTFFGYSYKDIPNTTAGVDSFGGFENFKNSLFGTFDRRIGRTWTVSGRLSWYDKYSPFPLTDQKDIGDYTRFDLRIAKDILDGRGTIELIGQNLFDPLHPEGDLTEIPRTLYTGLELRY